MLISLVVPCYNEEESLPIFYKEASKISQQMGMSHGADFEFIFVDDGSKDRTLQIARALRASTLPKHILKQSTDQSILLLRPKKIWTQNKAFQEKCIFNGVPEEADLAPRFFLSREK